MDSLRIGLIQMQSEKGAISQNLDTLADYLIEAKARAVDIVCFPEMSLTGYADPNRYPQAVIRLDGPEVGHFLELTKGFQAAVCAGIIEENTGQVNGAAGKPFITQIVARNGSLIHYYRKLTIKDEEELWFSPGDTVPVFKYGALTYGIAICADIGNEFVFAECARQGAQIIFEMAAPGLYGEQSTRNWQTGFEWWRGECRSKLGSYAQKFHQWIAVSTQAGRTMDEDFPGGGYVFSPDGQPVYETPDWSPGAVFLEINFSTQSVSIL